MTCDPWHYSRQELATHVLGMFESGLSSALVFFAPRRMGKTEFLCKDVAPLAEKAKWKVFYFSFLDVGMNAANEFTKALTHFSKTHRTSRAGGILKRVNKLSAEVIGVKAEVQFQARIDSPAAIKEVIAALCKKHKLLLLMDEVQTLTQDPANANFIAALRTVLDMHKERVKVIFTGSSQEGLRRMFSEVKAPFFHFGQNLPFPELDRGFTDHLANMFEKATKRKLDRETLWTHFVNMQKVPQLARALVERVALNPHLSLDESKKQLLSQIYDDRAFVAVWNQSSSLEKLLLKDISNGSSSPFSQETRDNYANLLGVAEITTTSVQSAIRVLKRKLLIGSIPEQRNYYIDDPNFKNWLFTLKL